MKKLLAALLIGLYPALCAGQTGTPIKQSGNVTPGHPVMWTTNGVVQDGGPALLGFLTGVGVVASGQGICQSSAPTGALNRVCFTASSTGAGFTMDSLGGATGPFTLTLNGATYQFPFSTSGVIGPNPTVVGHLATWNNTTGTLLAGDNIVTDPVVTGTTSAVRALNVGSNFSAAQPAEFNINDNQAPADARLGYFGVNTLGATNGAFINASFGSSAQLVNSGATPIIWASAFDTTVAKNQYFGEYHHYSVLAGTGGGLGGGALFVQCDLGGTWVPDNANAAGCNAINAASFTTLGGFVWGIVPSVNCTGTVGCDMVAAEFDNQYFTSGGGSKVGIQIVDQGGALSLNPGSNASTAFKIVRNHLSWGYDTGVLFPAGDGVNSDYPIRTTGTLIKSGTGTVTSGIDFSAMTFTDSAFKSGNGNVGVGTATPTANLDVNPGANSASVITASGVSLRTTAADGTAPVILLDSYGATNTITYRRTDGTAASRTGLVNNDVIGTEAWQGWTSAGAGSNNAASIRAVATETWSGSANGAQLDFRTTPNTTNTLTTAMSVFNSGGVGVGSGVGDPGVGKVNAANGYSSGGTAGLTTTKTVRAAGGGSDCTLIFTGGLLTGGSC